MKNCIKFFGRECFLLGGICIQTIVLWASITQLFELAKMKGYIAILLFFSAIAGIIVSISALVTVVPEAIDWLKKELEKQEEE